MAKNPKADAQVQQLLAAFLRLPLKAKIAVGVLAVVAGGLFYALFRTPALPESTEEKLNPPAAKPDRPGNPAELVNLPPPAATFPPGAKSVVLCLWNMENLFDDRDDKRRPVDEEYDNWFVEKPDDRRKKYDKLAGWLVKQNGGVGPDIVVGVEIESYRAADLLREALNAKLPAGAPKYQHVAMLELDAGRYIAPCVISRFTTGRAKLIGRRQRILQVQVTVNGHELDVIASHWTSQLSDDGSKEDGGRSRYATTIAEAYAEAIRANPKVDFLVCGDFNDSPESDSVFTKLRVVGDAKLVTPDATPPNLFGLLSGKNPAEFGTHYYNKPLIYDHIAVSPGMFDNVGWGFVPDSVQVPTDGLIRFGSKGRRPWRYGTAKDDALGRGFTDHFPVMVTLKVAP